MVAVSSPHLSLTKRTVLHLMGLGQVDTAWMTPARASDG